MEERDKNAFVEENEFIVPNDTKDSLCTIAECTNILSKIGYLIIGIFILLCVILFIGLRGEGIGIFAGVLAGTCLVYFLFRSITKFSDNIVNAIVRRDSAGFAKSTGELKWYFMCTAILMGVIAYLVITKLDIDEAIEDMQSRERILNEDE